jgi:hypothetical protein
MREARSSQRADASVTRPRFIRVITFININAPDSDAARQLSLRSTQAARGQRLAQVVRGG